MLKLDEIKKQLEERLQLLGAKVVEIEDDLRTPRSGNPACPSRSPVVR